MKDSLIESESCFICPAVSPLALTHPQALWTFKRHTYVQQHIHDCNTTICIQAEIPLIKAAICIFMLKRLNALNEIQPLQRLHMQASLHHTASYCRVGHLRLDISTMSVFHSLAARDGGVSQKAFQRRPCSRLRALSPARATSLNTADKASMPQPRL